MKDDLLAYWDDILRSGKASRHSIAGYTFEDYSSDELLRSGVERKLKIIGESLSRIKRDDPELLQQIPEHRAVIFFRNILVHGYDTIDDRIVWVSSKKNSVPSLVPWTHFCSRRRSNKSIDSDKQ